MNKFIWGIAVGWVLAVVVHSYGALLTFQEVFK